MAPINLNNETPRLDSKKSNYNEIDEKNTSISMNLTRNTILVRARGNSKNDKKLELHKGSNVDLYLQR